MPKKKPAAKAARKPSRAKPARKSTTTKARSQAKKPTATARVEALEKKLLKDKKTLVELRRSIPPERVDDYVMQAHDGSQVRLSDMFGPFSDLILIHNMGKGCKYCTMWADGFTGLVKHLENRAAFVVVSKDEVAMQRDFYLSRGWNFRMYSSHGSTFNRDMGFEKENGGQMPGVSAFHKAADGSIYRTGHTLFGPGDDFCAVWPMLDLLKDGPAGWEPKYVY